MKRLGDVVVGAEVQAFHLVFLIGFAGEHDDEAGLELRIRFQLLREHRAIHIRQAAIENRQVPRFRGQVLARFVSGRKLGDVVAAAFQKEPHQSADCRVIVDDRDLKSGHDIPSGKRGATV